MDYKSEQIKRMKLILLELDPENKKCADCSSGNVSYASINNGTIICTNCAEEHKKLENKVSFLKAFSERWDDYLLSYVKMGSNGRFTQFAKSYRIEKIPIENKYRTRACEYYRDLLRSEVMGYDPPDGINIRTAGEIVEQIEDNYPEFANYSYVKHVDLDNLEKKVKSGTTGGDSGLLGTVTGFFGNVTSKIDIAADYVAGLNVGEKIFEEGSKAISSMKSVVNENTKKLQGFIEDIVKDENEEGGEQGEEEGEGDEGNKDTDKDNNDKVSDNKKEDISTDTQQEKEKAEEKLDQSGGNGDNGGIEGDNKAKDKENDNNDKDSKEEETKQIEPLPQVDPENLPTLKIDQEAKTIIESEKDDF